jgi:hypothetical protein
MKWNPKTAKPNSTGFLAPPPPTAPKTLPEHHETLMDEEELVYAWEEDLVDEVGQLWVVGQ